MKLLIVALACFLLATNLEGKPAGYHDRLCGTNLTNLWLDVVAVVDNSIGMTNAGLLNIRATLQSVFDSSRIGVDQNEPRTTRVGIVTYNREATKNADLNQFQSTDDLFTILPQYMKISSEDSSYLINGLHAAHQLLSRINSTDDGSRDHYKQVVIVFASAYKGIGKLDPLPVAHRLKASDIHIITVAYDQAGDEELQAKLSQISSNGSSYSLTGGGQLVGEIQGDLLRANCFCPDLWFQYTNNGPYRYGTCVQPIMIPATWKAAQMSCRNRLRSTYLVNEFSQDKHDFVLNLVRNTTGFSEPFTYHIGLSKSGGTWKWDRPDGQTVDLDPDGSLWQPGYPHSHATLMAVQNQQRTQDVSSVGWVNIQSMGATGFYVCETVSCDTDNYCSADDVTISNKIF